MMTNAKMPQLVSTMSASFKSPWGNPNHDVHLGNGRFSLSMKPWVGKSHASTGAVPQVPRIGPHMYHVHTLTTTQSAYRNYEGQRELGDLPELNARSKGSRARFLSTPAQRRTIAQGGSPVITSAHELDILTAVAPAAQNAFAAHLRSCTGYEAEIIKRYLRHANHGRSHSRVKEPDALALAMSGPRSSRGSTSGRGASTSSDDFIR